MADEPRSVSPSLLISAARTRREEAFARRNAPSRCGRTIKRAAEDAMTELDTLAASGQISSGAYLSLGKRLKTVHDADEERTTRVRRKMAIEYACEVPFSMHWVPDDVEWFTISFMNELVRAKRRAIAKAPCGNANLNAATRAAADHANKLTFETWLGELVEHMMGSSGDTGLDGECRRNAMLLLLEVDSTLFAMPILHHLQTELAAWSAEDFFEDDEYIRHFVLEMAPALLPWMIEKLDPNDEDDKSTIDSLTETAEEA